MWFSNPNTCIANRMHYSFLTITYTFLTLPDVFLTLTYAFLTATICLSNPTIYFLNSAVTQVSATRVQLGLDHPFRYMHYGQYQGLVDGMGGYVDERAEVALLSRRIMIFGTAEAAPYDLQGEASPWDWMGVKRHFNVFN